MDKNGAPASSGRRSFETTMDSETHTDTEYLSTLERPVGPARLRARQSADDAQRGGGDHQMSPAAARRCLNTLVKLGYVAKHHRHFLLRPEVMSFASAYLDSMSLGELVRPHLQAVRDETGDSSSPRGAQRFRHPLSRACVDQPDGAAGGRRGHALSGLCDLAGPRDAGLRARGRAQPLSRHRRVHAVHPSTPSPRAPICASCSRTYAETAMPRPRDELDYG